MPSEPSLDPVLSVVKAYRPVYEEVDVALEAIEGSVPSGLAGVLYRNGAGKVEVGTTQQMHPFDGDGMVSRFELRPDGVRYRNRYVRTAEFEAERAAGRMLYRGFGTNKPGGLWSNLFRIRFKNAANTSVVWHGGRLLTLWEAGHPHALDPHSLATLGRFDYEGQLASPFPERLIYPEAPFSAHPTICPRTGEMFNFGLVAAPSYAIQFYRVSPGGDRVARAKYRLERPAFIHDFAVTERYAVFFITPVEFDVVRTLAGLCAPVEAIQRTPGTATDILVIDRNGRGPPRKFTAPSGFFLFHLFGAFEDEGSIVVHGARMADFKGGTVDLRDADSVRNLRLDMSELARWRIDLEKERVEETCFGGPGLELPTIDPRRATLPHRIGWAVARQEASLPIYTGLARVDLVSGRSEVRELGADIPGEPIFVPRHPDAAEGDGWLLTLVFRARSSRSELWILNAQSLTTEARFLLPHHQSPGFHGVFVPQRDA